MGHRKIVLSTVCLILLLVIVMATGMIYVVEFRTKNKYPEGYVLSAPPESLMKIVIPPYSGVHPRFKQRHEDHYSYPIKIGDVGPVKALIPGDLQYPFICGIDRSKLGQPLVDNQQGYGIPVYQEKSNRELSKTIVGYSKDCLIPTQAAYYYNRKGTNRFYPLAKAKNDIETIIVNGKEMEFVVRLELGTINRFLYAIAVLRGENETLGEPNGAHWNKRLIYQFRGGVGVGRKQGHVRNTGVLKRRHRQLAEGYAVVFSTANQTSNHYNIWLAEDTALRVKRQFTSLYGEPDYTVGIGGSGGGVQQYLFGQNNPRLLNAIIPLYSFPDMISQTINVLDCELLEYYFDMTDRQNPRWLDWTNRSYIEGFNATIGEYTELSIVQKIFSLWQHGHLFDWHPGQTECIASWRPLSSLVHNPNYHHYERYFLPKLFEAVSWTHWADLKYIYGTDKHGIPLHTWDNVGVQYGLNALKDGLISIDEFIRLNAKVGSWKPLQDMQPERFWIFGGHYFPIDFSVWGEQNMRLAAGSDKRVAPRNTASLQAIEAAYRSGMVFIGEIDIPIIDIRHYLEDELDMHHTVASFSSRQRIIDAKGHANQQIIWMTEYPYLPIDLALKAIDQWIQNLRDNVDLSVEEAKPAGLHDSCFRIDGSLIASGKSVWDGAWNHAEKGGDCQKHFPSYSTPRQLAGGGVKDDIFKCALQSIDGAIESGVYGDVDIRPYQKRLERLFPSGVCDYRLPDLGRPSDFWGAPVSAE